MKARTRVKENSEKRENKTERSPAKKRSKKVKTKREDPRYEEETPDRGAKARKKGVMESELGGKTTGDLQRHCAR
jgi:hypothetical protein